MGPHPQQQWLTQCGLGGQVRPSQDVQSGTEEKRPTEQQRPAAEVTATLRRPHMHITVNRLQPRTSAGLWGLA